MTNIIVLGATGALGSHVLAQAVAANHKVSVLVRNPSKLPADLRERVTVHQADIANLSSAQLAAIVRNQDALINAAGFVSEGAQFVALVDHIISSIETLPQAERPVCWFLGGAAALDIGASGRRGVDLPVIKKTYWPHAANFKRLQASSLDWRMLCPGPMVESPVVGLDNMRVSHDGLPTTTPAAATWLPKLLLVPLFASRIPEMIVSYTDAAALMLNNLEPSSTMSQQRVGLALPVGMRGKKAQWTARPSTAS